MIALVIEPKRAISKHIYSTADLTSQKTKDGHWALRCVGMLKPLLHVVPDAKYPSVMWRIMTPDGELSDMANLMRAKDAALSVALSIIHHWQADVTATEGP